VDIKYPLFTDPIININEGDLIYAFVDVDFSENNVTTLTANNFTVNIGTKGVTINEVTYNDTTSYYKINVTVPSNEAGSKQDFWVNVTYDSIWNTDIEMESVWYFAPPTTTTTIGGGGGGGGGGGSTIPITKIKFSNFTIDKDVIQILLVPGDSKKLSLKISNAGDTSLKINMTQQNLNDFLSFSNGKVEYSFNLNINETKDIQLKFSASEGQKPGVYMGRIVIVGDGIERVVNVIIEVESLKPLFDVKVSIPPEYREVCPGKDVMSQLTIYNIGRLSSTDVDVEYGVKNFDGNIIASNHELMFVQTELSVTKKINIPISTKSGNYVFYAIVNHDNIIGTGSTTFKVIEKKGFDTIMFLSILVLVVIIMFISILLRRYLRESRHLFNKRV
jgi:uncharacterized membrane protein